MAKKPTPEFRAEAVRVALTSGLPRKQVAADWASVRLCAVIIIACAMLLRQGSCRWLIGGLDPEKTWHMRKLALNVDHLAHKGINNRIEGSHRPTRKREKMKIQGRFKSVRQTRAAAFDLWSECTTRLTALPLIPTLIFGTQKLTRRSRKDA